MAAQWRRSRRRRRREAWSSLRACGPCTFSYLANLSIFYHHYGKRVVTRRHKHTHTRTYIHAYIHAAIGTQVTRMCGQGRGRFVLFCMATLFLRQRRHRTAAEEGGRRRVLQKEQEEEVEKELELKL